MLGHVERLPVALVVTAAVAQLASFGRTLSYALVWDDVSWIADNPMLSAPLTEGLGLGQHAHMGVSLGEGTLHTVHESYRPLAFASAWLDVRLFGRDGPAMHLESAVLGLAYLPLVYGIARALGVPAKWAAIAAIAFVLHPIQVEAFAYVSARADVLAGCFALVAMWLTVRPHAPQGLRGPSLASRIAVGTLIALAGCASLLAKEATIGWPLGAAVLLVATGQLRTRGAALLGGVAGIALYAVLRIGLAGQTDTANPGAAMVGLFELPGVALELASSMILPFDLSIARPVRSAYAWRGWVLTVLAALALVWRLRSNERSARIAGWIGAAWLFIVVSVGPSAVVAVIMDTVSDRYAHVAWLGPCLAGAALGHELESSPTTSRRRHAVLGFAGLWACMGLAIAWLQVPIWRNNDALYRHALAVEPESGQANYRVGYLYAQRGDFPAAIPYFERALAISPSDGRAHNNLGVSYLNLGRLREAERSFEQAFIVTHGASFRALHNLATLDLHEGRVERACERLNAALALHPAYDQASDLRDRACTNLAGGQGRDER